MFYTYGSQQGSVSQVLTLCIPPNFKTDLAIGSITIAISIIGALGLFSLVPTGTYAAVALLGTAVAIATIYSIVRCCLSSSPSTFTDENADQTAVEESTSEGLSHSLQAQGDTSNAIKQTITDTSNTQIQPTTSNSTFTDENADQTAVEESTSEGLSHSPQAQGDTSNTIKQTITNKSNTQIQPTTIQPTTSKEAGRSSQQPQTDNLRALFLRGQIKCFETTDFKKNQCARARSLQFIGKKKGCSIATIGRAFGAVFCINQEYCEPGFRSSASPIILEVDQPYCFKLLGRKLVVGYENYVGVYEVARGWFSSCTPIDHYGPSRIERCAQLVDLNAVYLVLAVEGGVEVYTKEKTIKYKIDHINYMQLNGHYLAATSKNNMLKIWDLETNKRLCQLENTNIIQLECLADGFLYASYDPSSSRRKNIYIWKPGFTSPRLYRSDHNYTLCATYGNYFAMVKSANKVEIFDENQNLLRQYEFSQETQIQEIRFSRAYILCKVAEGKRSGQSVIMDEESYKVLGFTV